MPNRGNQTPAVPKVACRRANSRALSTTETIPTGTLIGKEQR